MRQSTVTTKETVKNWQINPTMSKQEPKWVSQVQSTWFQVTNSWQWHKTTEQHGTTWWEVNGKNPYCRADGCGREATGERVEGEGHVIKTRGKRLIYCKEGESGSRWEWGEWDSGKSQRASGRNEENGNLCVFEEVAVWLQEGTEVKCEIGCDDNICLSLHVIFKKFVYISARL